MNTTVLKKALSAFEDAQREATADEKAAKLARQVARAAKIKLKQVRRLSKLTKKSARKAEDKAEQSLEALELASTRLEKLQKRANKDRRKGKPRRSSKVIHLSRHRMVAAAKPITARKKGEVTRRTRKPVRARQPRRPVVVTAQNAVGESSQPKMAPGANAGGVPSQKRPVAESHATRQVPAISPETETRQVPVRSNDMPNPSLLPSTQPQPGAGAIPTDV
jgi:hypothetical protein